METAFLFYFVHQKDADAQRKVINPERRTVLQVTELHLRDGNLPATATRPRTCSSCLPDETAGTSRTAMQRIVIVGSAGTGNSTLARRLGERLNIPVIHLDALNWQPDWQALPPEVFRAQLAEAISGDAWITDGNYALLTFDLRLPYADLFIWVERPRICCRWRVFRRALRGLFSTHGHLAAGCPERFDRRFWDRLKYILNFNRINRPRIEAARQTHGPHVPVIVLRSDREIAAFLARVKSLTDGSARL